MRELRFTIFGSLVSANALKAPIAGRLRKTKAAREDAARVAEIATVAAIGWELPSAASVTIWAWNSRLDAGNVEKGPCDALKGIAWRDDTDLMDLTVRRRWDDGGERYEVVVVASDDHRPERGAKKRAAAPQWSGGPIPEGYALVNGRLESRDAALAMIRKSR